MYFGCDSIQVILFYLSFDPLTACWRPLKGPATRPATRPHDPASISDARVRTHVISVLVQTRHFAIAPMPRHAIFSWYHRMPGLASVYVVGTVDTNQSITKGQVRTMTICSQVANIAWYPLYPFGHEYQAICTILFPNGCCANFFVFCFLNNNFVPYLKLDFGSWESGHVQQVGTTAMQRKGTASRCHEKWHI